jgi:ABC-type uncharacterized transport system involved in gliding motility auxiliary subunit
MSNKTRSILATIFVLIIAFCAIFIVNKKTRNLGWLDTTENDLYTLTDGTKSILDKLDQKLTVKLFYAHEAANRTNYDALLAYNNYYYYVRDVLRAYERAAKNKLVVQELDPRPYSDAEEEADRLQLQRFPITERDGFYFGLAVAGESGGAQTIKWLDPSEQALLEYKISEAIDLSTKTKKNKLGVLASVSVTGGGMSDYMRQMMAMQGKQSEQPWIISEHLRKQYDIVDVQADADSIPADVDFLCVIHPKDLGEKTLYAIDQFVVKGGKAMFFVDPFCIYGDKPARDPNNFGQSQSKQSSSLEKLLNAWGVAVEEGKFAGDLKYAQAVRASQMAREATLFAGVMNFPPDAFNQDEVAVRGLKQVTMVMAGAIRKKEGAGTEVTPLVTTTAQGNVWEAQSFELGGPGLDVARLASKFNPGVEKICVAARISGKFKSAFDKKAGSEEAKPANGDADKKDAKPEDAEGKPADGDKVAEGDKKDGENKAAEKKDDHVKESANPNTIFVVADVDLITDNGAYQRTFIGATPSNSNSDFVFNCIEQLSGSTDLISIRSRGAFNRPMTAVQAIEKEADIRTREQVARINADIEKVRSELSELDTKATEKNVGMLQAEAIDKQRALQAEVRKKERQIRDVQEAKLTEVEALGTWWKNITRVLVPLIVLIVGVVLGIRRYNVRKVTVLGGVS